MSTSAHCAADWSNVLVYPLYIMPIWYGLAFVSLLPFIAVAIKAFREKQLSSETRLFYLSMIFFIAICVEYLLSVLHYVFWCSDSVPEETASIMRFMFLVVYALQGSLLALILFFRLQLIFKDSVFAVSKCTKIAFVTLFGSGISFASMTLVLFVGKAGAATYTLFLGLSAVAYIVGVIWLTALFAYKLIKVHQMNDDSAVPDKGLVYVAIKTSLLCFVSICSIAANLTGFAMLSVGVVGSPHLKFIIVILAVCDLHTNFFSMLLTFSYFDSWYKQMCGRCCHQLCHRICLLCIGKKPISADMKMVARSLEVESRSGPSETTADKADSTSV